MKHTFQLIKHLCTATNHHGVHSPFVYGYVTKCLYNKKKYHKNRTINVLLKSIDYFQITSISIPQPHNAVKAHIISDFPKIKVDAPSPNLIFIDAPKLGSAALFKPENITPPRMICLDGIYKNSESRYAWESIKRLPQLTVTIDLFYCGIAFIREEQAKEHFKIRL